MTADYEDLDNSIKNLKCMRWMRLRLKSHAQSMIKMYFIQLPFCSSTFTRYEDHYEISIVELTPLPAPLPGPVTAVINISVPSVIWEGAVQANDMRNLMPVKRHLIAPFLKHDFVRDINKVHNAIKKTIALWHDLSKSSVIENIYDSDFQNISTALAISGASVSVASPTGESNIYSRLNLVKDPSDAMAGTSWDVFRSKFYELLPAAINVNNALAHYLASMIKAEGTLFREVRSLVADLVEKASQAFDSAGKSWSADSNYVWTLVLDIAVLVAGAAVEVVSRGSATLVVAANAVKLELDVIKTVVDKEERTVEGAANFDNVLDSFKNDLEAISHHVYRTKEEIGNDLTYNYM